MKAIRSFFGSFFEGKTGRVLLFVALCVVSFIFHIWLRTRVLQFGYEVGGERRAIATLESDLARLRVTRARLFGPANLQHLVQEFGEKGSVFRAPQPQQLLYPSAGARP